MAEVPYYVEAYRAYRDHVPPDPWEAAMATEPADNENWPDPDAGVKHCAEPGCPRTKPDHQWAYKTPEGKGWFDQRNGDSWCPDHIPSWVEEWRATRDTSGVVLSRRDVNEMTGDPTREIWREHG